MYSRLALSACSMARIDDKHGAHFLPFVADELRDQLPALRRVPFRDARVRPTPSASAISVTVAPEASAFAMRARRPSRRSSVLVWVSVAVLRVFTLANRHDETEHAHFLQAPFRIPVDPQYPSVIRPSFNSFSKCNGFTPILTRRCGTNPVPSAVLYAKPVYAKRHGTWGDPEPGNHNTATTIIFSLTTSQSGLTALHFLTRSGLRKRLM